MRVTALCATSEEILSRESPAQTAKTAGSSPPTRPETPIPGADAIGQTSGARQARDGQIPIFFPTAS